MKQIIDPPLPRKKWRVAVGSVTLSIIGLAWLIVFTIDACVGGSVDWLRNWLEQTFDRVGYWMQYPNRWLKQSRKD